MWDPKFPTVQHDNMSLHPPPCMVHKMLGISFSGLSVKHELKVSNPNQDQASVH